jgi:hypothetical protein
MKFYLAGPMTGYPRHNYPAFHAAAARLRARRGHDCVNPAEVNPESEVIGSDLPSEQLWRSCMKRDLPMMIQCDAVAVLPGWKRSRGARLEVSLAAALDMPIYEIAAMPHDDRELWPTLPIRKSTAVHIPWSNPA